MIVKHELSLKHRDMAISKVHYLKSKGEYRKALKLLDFLLATDPDLIVAQNLRSEILYDIDIQ